MACLIGPVSTTLRRALDVHAYTDRCIYSVILLQAGMRVASALTGSEQSVYREHNIRFNNRPVNCYLI